jgi:hypothetical protein
MENPRVGDVVLHNNGNQAEVTGIGNLATQNGLVDLYNLKFLEGMITGVNCLRKEFTFPLPVTR